MPNSTIHKLAHFSHKSVPAVEKIWDETKEQAGKKFKESDPAFWAYLNKTVQYKLGLAKKGSSSEHEEHTVEPSAEDLKITNVTHKDIELLLYRSMIQTLSKSSKVPEELVIRMFQKIAPTINEPEGTDEFTRKLFIKLFDQVRKYQNMKEHGAGRQMTFREYYNFIKNTLEK